MTVTTIPFNNGNAFSVGPTEIHSAAATLPSTVTVLEVQILDPNNNRLPPMAAATPWTQAANAGGTFVYGVQYSSDGGTTWNIALSNAVGQPVGSLNKDGSLPNVVVTGDVGLTHLYGSLVRAFASCTPQTISINAQAVVTT